MRFEIPDTVTPHDRDACRGSALVYILIAVALLAALTVSFMEPSSQQGQAQNTTNIVSELYSQIGFVSSAIQECTLAYPNQENGLTTTQQKNAPFPINPKDTYYTTASATPGPAANQNVEGVRCPGNPGGSAAGKQNHAAIFGATSGKFFPPPPGLFGPWEYYNGADGVYISIATNKTDPFIATALAKLDDRFSECEADVIDATAALVNMSSDTVPGDAGVKTCPSGSRCFRYWLILKPATSLHGDGAGC